MIMVLEIILISIIYILLTIGMLHIYKEAPACPDWLGTSEGLGFLNPEHIYKHSSCNIFGVIALALLLNTIYAPYAIFYWLYKLCTIKRR